MPSNLKPYPTEIAYPSLLASLYKIGGYIEAMEGIAMEVFSFCG